jgi:adenosylcobinamide-phosphate synthase
MAFLLSIYLILHLIVGFTLPYRRGVKPGFFMLVEAVGIDLEHRLNREMRPQSVRFIRGAVVGIVMGLGGILLGYIVGKASLLFYGFFAELLFLSLCINFMTPLKVVRQITRHLGYNALQPAIDELQPYTREPLDQADAHTVIRKTIEFIALSLNQFLLAPIFWFMAVGPIGLSVYVIYNALQQAFGLPDERHKFFGKFVRVADRLLNIVPAILTAALLALSALFVNGSSPLRAARTILDQGGRYHSLYKGWLIAAIAGGLGVTLGGPVRYNASYAVDYPWIGPEGASARLAPADISRAALLQYVFAACIMGIVPALIILKG